MSLTLEQALRSAKHIGVVNLFRNRARGGWQASVAKTSDDLRFSVGIDDDPAEALLKALVASAAGAPAPDPGPAPAPSDAFSKGIFG